MTDLPDLKIKALVSFPAAVFGGTGLAVRQENGKFYFDLAYGELAQISAIPALALPTTFLALWEQTQDTYRRMSIPDLQTQIGGGGGSVTPSDVLPQMAGVAAAGLSALYSRGDHIHPTDTSRAAVSALPVPAAATPLVASGAGAVGASAKYAREDHVHPASGISEAPNDGQQYARQSLNWAVVTGGGGGISDAPSDGKTYSRKNAAWIDAWASPAFSGNPTAPTPTAGDSDTSVATTAFVAAAIAAIPPSGGMLRSYLAGLTLSTPGSTGGFSVAAGVAADSTNADMMTLAAALNKNAATAWAVGSGSAGALDTGAFTINTWYHVHQIKRPDTSVVDACISLSPTAPTIGGNIPAAYTRSRRIGSMRTNAGGTLIKFFQNGDTFIWDVPMVDVSVSNPGTAAVTRTLTTPSGVKTSAIMHVLGVSNTNASVDAPGAIFITDLDQADTAAVTNLASSVSVYSGATVGFQLGGMAEAVTNASSQVRSRLQISTAGTALIIQTHGWRDRRGRDA